MKTERVLDLQHAIWRNLPVGATTFGACPRCETGSGRGGGLCLVCAGAELGELVGNGLARKYIKSIMDIRKLEAEMDAKAAGEEHEHP